MVMVVVDDSCLQADSQHKSGGLVWGSTAVWRCSTFIKWTEWTLAMTFSGHDDSTIYIYIYIYRCGYYYCYLFFIITQWRLVTMNNVHSLEHAFTQYVDQKSTRSISHICQWPGSRENNQCHLRGKTSTMTIAFMATFHVITTSQEVTLQSVFLPIKRIGPNLHPCRAQCTRYLRSVWMKRNNISL